MGSQGKDHLSRSVHCIPPGTTYMSADITKREKLFRIRLVVQYSDKMYSKQKYQFSPWRQEDIS